MSHFFSKNAAAYLVSRLTALLYTVLQLHIIAVNLCHDYGPVIMICLVSKSIIL